ncbi:MAG: hypothetical protein PHW52_01500 [Candidatus Pacebacteria bacterium]|nr:hypothetical protein [Candidatus Paceibacterota bacterium]
MIDYLRFRIYFLKVRVWNCTIKLWWYRLWVRRNEFHPSLTIDDKAMSCMLISKQKTYLSDLNRRREIAHKRDMKRMEHPNYIDRIIKFLLIEMNHY